MDFERDQVRSKEGPLAVAQPAADESDSKAEMVARIPYVSQIMSSLVSGIALFSYRLSNSHLIDGILEMLFFGFVIDKFGRQFGIVIATAAHGSSDLGLFWTVLVAQGVAGFGAGGEYPVCGTSSAEAADESPRVRSRRGTPVAIATDFSIDLGFVAADVVDLIMLAASIKIL